MPQLKMSDKGIASLRPPEQGQVDHYDVGPGSLKGLILKASYAGTKSWYLLIRPKGVRGSRQIHLGTYPALKLAKARQKARELQAAIAYDPEHLDKIKRQRTASTFEQIANEFKTHYLEAKKLRTRDVMWGRVKTHLIPAIGKIDFNKISLKHDLVPLFDRITTRHGAAQADNVLSVLRSIVTFQIGRDENARNFLPSRGIKRYKPNPRKRVLNDDEIKALWRVTSKMGTFGHIARLALVTGQRREKIRNLKWSEIQEGTWHQSRELNEKPNAGRIILPTLAMEIIEAQPRISQNPFVFAGERKQRGPFSAFPTAMPVLLEQMRARLGKQMQPFVFHDLRRTFRTKCSQLNIPRETAERCMGHVIGNAVERTYDQFRYDAEMGEAFKVVADHLAQITRPDPPRGNVVRLRL